MVFYDLYSVLQKSNLLPIAVGVEGSEYIRCAKDGVFKEIAGCGALE